MAELNSSGSITKKAELKKCKSEFRFGQLLGEGSYSTVLLAEEKSTGLEFAVKVIRKRHIVKERKTAQVCCSQIIKLAHIL